MPIYEFCCNSCDTEFEELVIGSAAEICCPECNSADIKKKMSTFAHKCGGTFRSSHSCSCDSCTSGAGGCSSCSCH